MRRAVVRTPLPDAARIAAAVSPDNTPELGTSVVDETVVTTVTRETTGGLRATLDDYLVNLAVATETGAAVDRVTNGPDRTRDHFNDQHVTDTTS